MYIKVSSFRYIFNELLYKTMKKLLIFTIFFISISIIQAGNISNINNSISLPITKSEKNNKSPKKTYHHYNPYKMASFCRLIQIGNYKAVKKLIEQGADVNEKSLKLTPLMYAARHNRVEILKLLITNGANLKTRNCNGDTALKWAKMSGAKEAYMILQKALKK